MNPARHVPGCGLAAFLAALCAASACAQVTAPPDPLVASPAASPPAVAEAGVPEDWAFHMQSTVVYQYHPSFHSPYQGPNSMTPAADGRETVDVTLYGGVRLWKGAEFWINPEVDQGFGLSNTLGAAGFPSGEAYKVGDNQPYGRVHRMFIRQTVNLDGDTSAVDADLNQLAGTQSANRLVFTAGKFSVVDIFDNNVYAHDPRNDFLNWSIIDSAAFDYAANAWGYTYGIAGEWYQDAWTYRLGLFDLSTVPNSSALDPRALPQYQVVAELEKRYALGGQPGTVRLLGFALHGDMGHYADATAIADVTGQPADIAEVRSTATKVGAALNLQQQLAADLGLFVRLSAQQGQYEAFEFTDVTQSLATGLSMTGERWQRSDDTVGLAMAVNQTSGAAKQFFNAGGLGILVGDGQLPNAGTERIVETYYRVALVKDVHLSLDYQYIDNPGYNRDRGPVSVFGARLHAQF
jgi:high affinity Mn2+ porin